MYQLPCPHCQATVLVPPSQAGDQVQCPACAKTVQVPKLGDLKKLPEELETPGISSMPLKHRESGARSPIAMMLLGLICTTSLLIAGYSGIRWYLTEVNTTTESHLNEVRELYPTRNPAELLREYEEMEKMGLELPMPYRYKQQLNVKNEWGLNASVAAIISILALIGALFFASSNRKNPD